MRNTQRFAMQNRNRPRIAATFGLAAPLLLLVSQTSGLDPILASHESKLTSANSLTAKFTVQKLPGAPVEYSLTYSKPNMLRVDSPDGFTLTDGKTLWVYDKAKNSYTEAAADEKTALNQSGAIAVYAWSSFFNKEALKEAKGAKAGAKRNIKGNVVNEITFTTNEGKQTVTMYIDAKLGIARGASVRVGEVETIVLASELTMGTTALDAAKFAFTPPTGSTKVEAPAPGSVTYSQVAPIFSARYTGCHNPGQRAGGLDLTTLDALKSAGRAAVSGNSRASSIVRSMRSGRMPQGGARVPDADIDLIANWIDGGMKE